VIGAQRVSAFHHSGAPSGVAEASPRCGCVIFDHGGFAAAHLCADGARGVLRTPHTLGTYCTSDNAARFAASMTDAQSARLGLFWAPFLSASAHASVLATQTSFVVRGVASLNRTWLFPRSRASGYTPVQRRTTNRFLYRGGTQNRLGFHHHRFGLVRSIRFHETKVDGEALLPNALVHSFS
jgi:hypothetical protein